MLKSQNLKNVLLTTLAFCTMDLMAQASPVKFCGQSWSLYPKGVNVQFEQDGTVTDDKRVVGKVTSPDLKAAFSIYTYIPMKGAKSYKISFQYMVKDFQASGNVQLSLNFNKKNGGNASAGAAKFPVNIDSEKDGWQSFSNEAQVPPDTEMCQFAISCSGIKGTFWLGDLKVEDINDSFAVNRTDSSPVIDGRLEDECWKNAVPLFPFYVSDNSGKSVKKPTSAFIAYDDKNLYVAFKNSEPEMDKILASVKDRDGSLWNDDCNEIFIAAPNGKVLQFIVNSNAVQWDGFLSVKVPGDPYKADAKWNGDWKSTAFRDKDSWTTEICIPFSNFQQLPRPGEKWYINLARENKVNSELSHFNRVMDVFNNAAKFACLEFSDTSANLRRYSEMELADPFGVARKSPKFKELLSGEAGKYVQATWSKECVLNHCPPEIKEKYTPETFSKEQDAILSEYGQAGLLGPVAFPWAAAHLGMQKIKDFYEKYGIKYWFMLTNSSLSRKAIEQGASYVAENDVDPCDPVYQQVVGNYAKEYIAANKDKLSYLQFILGKDEPMNPTFKAYSATLNEKHKDALQKLDGEIKAKFGFGKYGLYDAFALKKDPSADPFSMIAFMNWWSNAFAGSLKNQREMFKEYAPGVQYIAYNMNCCSCFGNENISVLAPYTDWVSVDPYPTSAMYNYGRNRALYHTGFSLKVMKDLSGGKPACGILQAFSYCGRTPSPGNMREWASQALKNGAELIFWFSSGNAPARISLPEVYKEMLRLSKIIHDMNKLEIPSETKTAVFFSNPSHWGNFDKAVHSWYAVYSILGENLKTWFRFVSDSGLKLKLDDISKYKTVYIPQIKYCEADTADLLLNYVKNGGRLIISDPEAFTWNIDGTRLDKVRNELIGCQTGKALDVKNMLVSMDYYGLKKGDELSLTPLAHRTDAGKIQAFEIVPPAGAKVFANYPDGKAAAFERTLGKGSVIYFAAQPFGNSDLAVKDSKWPVFMKGIAEDIGEKTDLPIWDFELPATGGEIEVKYVINPDVK